VEPTPATGGGGIDMDAFREISHQSTGLKGREGSSMEINDTDTPKRHDRRRYRIEHWNGSSVCVLDIIGDLIVNQGSLTPYVARLILDGASGEVVLIDDRTEKIIARHILAHGLQRHRNRSSESRPR
jgi:hypothetical protein